MLRGPRLRPAALALALAAWPSGCDDTRTEVVVVLDTDVPRTDMDGYRVLVFGPEDLTPDAPEQAAVTDRTFPILDEPPFALPASFGVGPRDGDASRRVRIVIQGRLTALESPENPFGTMGIETSAVTAFVEDQVRRLDLFLAAACAESACGPAETCGAGGCVAEEVDPRALPRWEGL